MDQALGYALSNHETFVSELEDFLRIPSVSTDPEYAGEVRRAAIWLVDHFKALGFETAEAIDTSGHPIVYAEMLVDESLPTVLVYGHYDVQPADPLELWDSPPFDPVRKGNLIYGRGTCDDKGQVFMHLKAVEAYLKTDTPLPVNLKYLIEGEEESGSTNLPGFITENSERLKADVVLVSDTALFGPGVPSICYGLRGLAYVEVTLTGPDRDLHSGIYGGAVENPINALASMIAALHDDMHRVTIEGFYDNVRPLTTEERDGFAALPFDAAAWAKEVGVDVMRTEDGYSPLEAATARPTLDCNGIWGGYTGEGAKTVLPGQATAKISMRLVPDQTPHEITQKIRAHFEANTPDTMHLTFRDLHGGHGVLVDTKSTAMKAAREALEGVYGMQPHFVRGGGSIPVVADFKKILNLDTVLMGFGLDTDAIHSPNECFGLDRFQEGIQAVIRFLDIYGSSE
ncbi:MAG: acetylornithine deacetylase/succinyl-diaminopimelate desuccinylase-like protein [Rhodothermales bacterium]|jgi:acetylornithine deacetylase/succinyl-diaminopimelate desuccinylase-like protein